MGGTDGDVVARERVPVWAGVGEAVIAIRPDTDAGRVLRLLVDYPGELRAEDLGRMLWPPPRRGVSYRDAADRRAWLHLVDEHHRETAARAARLIGRLQEAGMVERMGGVRVASWFLEDVAARGMVPAMRRALPSWPAKAPDVSALAAIVREVENPPGGARLRRRRSGSIRGWWSAGC